MALPTALNAEQTTPGYSPLPFPAFRVPTPLLWGSAILTRRLYNPTVYIHNLFGLTPPSSSPHLLSHSPSSRTPQLRPHFATLNTRTNTIDSSPLSSLIMLHLAGVCQETHQHRQPNPSPFPIYLHRRFQSIASSLVNINPTINVYLLQFMSKQSP